MTSFLRSAINAVRKAATRRRGSHCRSRRSNRAARADNASRSSRELASRYMQPTDSRAAREARRDPADGDAEAAHGCARRADSGLDIDALRVVAGGVKELVGPNMGALVITHYQRILDYITPDHVHVFVDGRIVESGGPELAKKLEADG